MALLRFLPLIIIFIVIVIWLILKNNEDNRMTNEVNEMLRRRHWQWQAMNRGSYRSTSDRPPQSSPQPSSPSPPEFLTKEEMEIE